MVESILAIIADTPLWVTKEVEESGRAEYYFGLIPNTVLVIIALYSISGIVHWWYNVVACRIGEDGDFVKSIGDVEDSVREVAQSDKSILTKAIMIEHALTFSSNPFTIISTGLVNVSVVMLVTLLGAVLYSTTMVIILGIVLVIIYLSLKIRRRHLRMKRVERIIEGNSRGD